MTGGDGWGCGRCGGDNPGGTRFCGHCGAPATDAAMAGAAVEAVPETASEAATDAAEAATASAVLRSFVAGPLAERLERGALEDERRLVTSLFADLSGFTPLADRLDPEQLQEVIDPLIAMLSDVVARHEGYVDKYAGDALLAIFGAPVSHEDDAARALQVALEMHDELRKAADVLPVDTPLTLHVGVNSGHVVARVLGHQVRMDYAVVGDAVILAQRLESAASGGETYVGESTYRLTRHAFEFEALPPLTLKGKREPVPAWRLLGRRVPHVRSSSEPAAPLIGRVDELHRGERLLREAVEGRGGVCLVTGEPGIGKTALTDELRRQASQLDVRWLDGRCISYGAALPYWPYVGLLRHLLAILPDQIPDRIGGRLAEVLPGTPTEELVPYFERLLGLDPVGTPDVEPEAFQRGLRRAFSTLLEALATERPTVVAIEDVHWMDPSSLALTADLAHVCRDHGIVLYLTGRPESTDLLVSIGDLVPADRRHLVQLGPLGPVDAAALIRSIARQPVAVAVQAAVAERTGGNPLFVEEVIRWIEEAGAPAALSPGDVEGLPPTVEGLLSARIDRLSAPAASVLQTASIIGRTVPMDLLDAVTGTPDVRELVDILVGAGFLDSDGEDRVVFHHPLVQETAYGRLLRRQRVRLHLRVADTAERLYGARDDSLALLARHLYLGASPKALDYLVRAAAVAKRLYANDEAIVHLQRAAEVAGGASPDDLLPGVLVDLADLHELRGHLDEAIEGYRRAREAGGDWRSDLGLASTLRKRGRYDEALQTLDEAAATLPPTDPGHRALGLERARTLLVSRRTADAAEVLDRELGLVDGRSVHAGYLKLLLSRAELAHLDRSLALCQEAREILTMNDDHRGVVGAMRNLGWVYCLRGEMELAVEALREGIELGERMGNAEELAACLLNLGMVLSRRGEVDAAVDCDIRAIQELERMGHETGRVNGYANLASALARGGRHAEALAASERALEAARRLGDQFYVADSYLTQAIVHLAQSDPGVAAPLAEEAARIFEQLGAGPPARDALILAARAWDEDGQTSRGDEARKRAGLDV